MLIFNQVPASELNAECAQMIGYDINEKIAYKMR